MSSPLTACLSCALHPATVRGVCRRCYVSIRAGTRRDVRLPADTARRRPTGLVYVVWTTRLRPLAIAAVRAGPEAVEALSTSLGCSPRAVVRAAERFARDQRQGARQ